MRSEAVNACSIANAPILFINQSKKLKSKKEIYLAHSISMGGWAAESKHKPYAKAK